MALKPITLWYAQKWGSRWDSGAWRDDANYQAVATAIGQAAGELGLDASDGAYWGYNYTGDDLDAQLRLNWFELPQLLFSTPAEVGGDEYNVSESVFLAKLVGKQITADNIKIMLQAVRRLERKHDAANTGKVEFYDPSLHLLSGIGIRRASHAPGEGGYFLGLNPVRGSLTINREGQKLQIIVDTVKKVAPWALLAAGAYAISKKA